ncbi:glycosyltransferase family 2 protein [Tenacibaculum maritimum]|uniref:glycosyltransferase family 2 protein n=1 Tax=Tenacibaculum maritimum TaxID=107401 RepID=UPI001E32FBA9|nr:glycosyltransferase family 2 protein [Tenacibaculum maritimum]MCD9563683.1 glycosyltransferase family 2 protein [Tenacibaculum maritimum]MCD9566995.1 glycosyltransferase family 2 protein [Tenacibaculum maritimum]MCD9579462.1 glycosyltransferase family 2 protein [Tenacibaculum maritimum]MCD9596221.1 glycosyltransferase family 2 protein [Tenacibaculum maritimum]MCD9613470.1 glycosyltransferase family 2 protein [Tenacibaculum maritimum]
MKTAIVILNWNGKKLLEQFLPSVIKYSAQLADIYVADNASSDDSIAYIQRHFPSIKIIQNTVNGGYAKGYNDALQHVDASIYCLLNSDIEVTENWLLPVINVFQQEKNTAIIQPKLLDFKQKTMFEYAGAAGGFIDAFGYPYCRGRIFNDVETDLQQFDDTAAIFWASGACFFIRSEVFHELQGFDEDYFAHQEEIDLCWRAKNKGFDIMYVGGATVYHVGGATLEETNPQKTFLNFRNSLFNILKNVPAPFFLLILFARLILDGIAGLKFLLSGKPMHTWAIVRGHFSFYKNFFKMINKRKSLAKTFNYNLHTSIIWQYFVLGRKKFNDLK